MRENGSPPFSPPPKTESGYEEGYVWGASPSSADPHDILDIAWKFVLTNFHDDG
jgi:hypothetical protein